MRNIPLSDLTVAQAGGHTVISIGDSMRHIGPSEPVYYEKALDLSVKGFSCRQVSCILGIDLLSVSRLATGNRPYPEVLKMRVVKGRGPVPDRRTVGYNSQDNSYIRPFVDDDVPHKSNNDHRGDSSHTRHDDSVHNNHTPSSGYDSPSDSSPSDSSSGGGGSD